jgi:polysaccharide export outer membrane protein
VVLLCQTGWRCHRVEVDDACWLHPACGPPAVLATACAPQGRYIWSDTYQAAVKPQSPEYLVAVGDLINVRVYNQEGMSAKVRVRSDGRVSLPFLGDVEAAGSSPTELSRRLQLLLKSFVLTPVVTVSLEEASPLEVYVVGEVVHPGRYRIDQQGSILLAIAAAGGLTPFAVDDRIFVIRREPEWVRIRFRLESLTHNPGKDAAFRLRTGDTIVAE